MFGFKYMGKVSDEEHDNSDQEQPRSRGNHTKDRVNKKANGYASAAKASARSRPTNNQLLYKAYFRWQHYPCKMRNGTHTLPTETDSCASVTAAFLQVLHTLHTAETMRIGSQRNVLQILSTNTRRTKVVELSTGTHRVPDELKKHYLSDGENGQYSTNLDRNRYGNDDQYLFTVVRYDLEYLGLCPCMVDVEIIDAKNDHQSIFVSAGPEACTCQKDPSQAVKEEQRFSNNVSRGERPGSGDSAKKSKSASGVSQLFDALVMAATGGGVEGGVGGGDVVGSDPPVTSKFGSGTGAPGGSGMSLPGGNRTHPLPAKQRSRLWSALSYGDVDSLQNALDAFRAEEEIASGQNISEALGDGSLRKRSRKPMRGPSSSYLGLDSSLLGSLFKSGLREKSDENTRDDVISSGAGPGTGGVKEEFEGEGEEEEEAEAEGPAKEEEGDSQQGPDPGGEAPVEGDPDYEPPAARRVRVVPRQSSVANLHPRVSPMEVKRLTGEVDMLRQENQELRLQIEMRCVGDAACVKRDLDTERARIRQLEQEMIVLRSEMQQLIAAKRVADENLLRLSNELSTTRTTANLVVSKLLLQNGHGLNPFGPLTSAAPSLSSVGHPAAHKLLQQMSPGMGLLNNGMQKRLMEEMAELDQRVKRQALEQSVCGASGLPDVSPLMHTGEAGGSDMMSAFGGIH